MSMRREEIDAIHRGKDQGCRGIPCKDWMSYPGASQGCRRIENYESRNQLSGCVLSAAGDVSGLQQGSSNPIYNDESLQVKTKES